MPRGAARHDGRCHNEGRKRHMNEPEREQRVEDDFQPVERHNSAVHDVEALRRLHPTVRSKDPKRREQRTECDQGRGEKMQACPDALPAEQHDAEETGFEEKRCQDLVGEQRSVDGTRDAGEAGPVCAELVGHHDTGDDAHAKTDCENLRPEEKEFAINRLAGSQPQSLEHGAIVREPDADCGKDDVGRDRERELQPRRNWCITGARNSGPERFGAKSARLRFSRRSILRECSIPELLQRPDITISAAPERECTNVYATHAVLSVSRIAALVAIATSTRRSHSSMSRSGAGESRSILLISWPTSATLVASLPINAKNVGENPALTCVR